jgi:hypothetical protein
LSTAPSMALTACNSGKWWKGGQMSSRVVVEDSMQWSGLL